MSRTTKIILAVVVILLVLCACGCVGTLLATQFLGSFLAQSAVEDPAEVAALGATIADYSVPAGYTQEFGMSMFGFTVVGLTSGQDNAIILMQLPQIAGVDQASLEQQMRQSIQERTNTGDMQMEKVGETTVTIRDQPVTLTISEGTNDQGEAIRQMMGTFPGKNGPAMLMIIGRVESWDQAAIDAFIASIN